MRPLTDAPAHAERPGTDVPAGGRLAAVLRRPVLATFLLALAARAVAAIAITVGWGGSLFLDDATYSRMAQAAADGRLSSLGAYPVWLYERTGTLLVPVTALYEVFGPVKLAGQLYVGVLGAAAAALTTRVAMEVVDRRWAIAAGVVVALLPSQILWSSIIMKDAAVWMALSGLAVVAAVAARTTGRRLVVLAAIAAALLGMLGFLRLYSLEVAAVALVLAALFSMREQRQVRIAGAVALLLVVPMAFGMGPAGAPFVAGIKNPAEQRAANAQEAQSAVVSVEPSDEPAAAANLSYLPTGLTVIALRPWPWEGASGSTGVRLARLETVLWYPLIALALVGLTAAWRRRAALAFPVICGGAVALMYGLIEGNLGTAYRHRGEVVWAVVLLAALGAQVCAARLRERRPAPAGAA